MDDTGMVAPFKAEKVTNFPATRTPIPALGPTFFPAKELPETIQSGAKPPGCLAHRWTPTSAELKNV